MNPNFGAPTPGLGGPISFGPETTPPLVEVAALDAPLFAGDLRIRLGFEFGAKFVKYVSRNFRTRYHSRKNLRSSQNDLRSLIPKRFPTKITPFVWKKFCANFVNKLSLPSPFVCTKVFPKLLKNQFQKYFWAFMILNYFKLILSFFMDGTDGCGSSKGTLWHSLLTINIGGYTKVMVATLCQKGYADPL